MLKALKIIGYLSQAYRQRKGRLSVFIGNLFLKSIGD